MKRIIPLISLMLAYGGVIPLAEAGVIAHWTFEEGTVGAIASGANSILDSSGNGLHMTPNGGPIYRSVSNPGSTLGLEFDQINDIASRADSSLFQLQSLTVEAFIRHDGGGGLNQIFFRGDSRGSRDPIYFGVLNGKLRFNIANSSVDQTFDTTTDIQTGVFTHVAATLDDSTDLMTVYINGTAIGSQSAGGVRPTVGLFANARVSIGGLSDGNSVGQYFDGVIDEVRISDTALLPSQFLSSVPEPSSFGLLMVGLIGCIGRRRRS